MYWIIGTEDQLRKFEQDNIIPYFEYEDQLDDDLIRLSNYEEDSATMTLNLDTEIFYVSNFDYESGYTNRVKHNNYDEALADYRQREDQ